MIVQARFAALKGIAPHEWALRFVFGGVCCVVAGFIADRYGPAIGGLFMAFPAIFPAGASLIEAHEEKHKARAGFNGTNRGRVVASVDAAGASIGAIGLAGFALVLWRCLPLFNTWAVCSLATVVWTLASICFWLIRKSRFLHRKR